MNEKKNKNLGNYLPLIAMIAVALLASTSIAWGYSLSFEGGMHVFMGLTFCLFALLKLFDVPHFADGFQLYDCIAKRSRIYALSYPFIELLVGLGYLAKIFPQMIYSFTILLMGVSSVGVVVSLRKGLNLQCACMGTTLKVPLSTVTLTENLGMGCMALYMLMN